MNKESKTYKSVKTVSKSGVVTWRPRWVEFDSDGNKALINPNRYEKTPTYEDTSCPFSDSTPSKSTKR